VSCPTFPDITDRVATVRHVPLPLPRSSVVVLGATLTIAGLLSPASASVPAVQTQAPRTMVALGDSVPSGAVCQCLSFPYVYARYVTARTGVRRRVFDEARSGETSTTMLAQLRTRAVRQAIRSALTVIIMVGANDYAPAFAADLRGSCTGSACYRSVRRTMQANVAAAIAQVKALRSGHAIHIIVIGYWNVVKDGAVGRRAYGAAGLAKARAATQDANLALLATAQNTHTAYVSTRVALEGVNNQKDPTPYLAADGDHPNASGHRLIGEAVYARVPRG